MAEDFFKIDIAINVTGPIWKGTSAYKYRTGFKVSKTAMEDLGVSMSQINKRFKNLKPVWKEVYKKFIIYMEKTFRNKGPSSSKSGYFRGWGLYNPLSYISLTLKAGLPCGRSIGSKKPSTRAVTMDRTGNLKMAATNPIIRYISDDKLIININSDIAAYHWNKSSRDVDGFIFPVNAKALAIPYVESSGNVISSEDEKKKKIKVIDGIPVIFRSRAKMSKWKRRERRLYPMYSEFNESIKNAFLDHILNRKK